MIRYLHVVVVVWVLSSIIQPLVSDTSLINSNNNVDCYNDYAFEGSFQFLDNKGEAYWHLESDNVYFEYYFPASYWIGIAASNQYVNNEYNYCVDCVQAQNEDISHCLSQCVGNNMFVATSKGDNDPELEWNVLEFQTENNGHNTFSQYQISSRLHSVWGIKGRDNASFHLEKVNINGNEYMHGLWRRELNLDNGENKWIQPINDFDDICWTVITSKENNPNARTSELGYFIDKDSVEIHCGIGKKKICNHNVDHITNFGVQMTNDGNNHVCQSKNLSLIILMDSSMSVSDYFEVSKLWILNLLQNTAEIIKNNNNNNNNININNRNDGSQALKFQFIDPGYFIEDIKQNNNNNNNQNNNNQNNIEIDAEINCKYVSTTFSCHVYYPHQFRALRRRLYGYDTDDYNFVESLSRCQSWTTSGGKSGSTFKKTLDHRFVLKFVKQNEFRMFLDNAQSYFEHQSSVLFKNYPSVLVHILGVYQISWHKSNSAKSNKFGKYVIVMPNLWYSKNIKKQFDLKGALRNRYVN
eukprot:345856_1